MLCQVLGPCHPASELQERMNIRIVEVTGEAQPLTSPESHGRGCAGAATYMRSVRMPLPSQIESRSLSWAVSPHSAHNPGGSRPDPLECVSESHVAEGTARTHPLWCPVLLR